MSGQTKLMIPDFAVDLTRRLLANERSDGDPGAKGALELILKLYNTPTGEYTAKKQLSDKSWRLNFESKRESYSVKFSNKGRG